MQKWEVLRPGESIQVVSAADFKITSSGHFIYLLGEKNEEIGAIAVSPGLMIIKARS